MIGFRAFTGCDTTSAFWRKGKVRPLHLMFKNPDFIATFAELGVNWETNEHLLEKTEKFVCAMYGHATSNSVNTLRYATFRYKIS